MKIIVLDKRITNIEREIDIDFPYSAYHSYGYDHTTGVCFREGIRFVSFTQCLVVSVRDYQGKDAEYKIETKLGDEALQLLGDVTKPQQLHWDVGQEHAPKVSQIIWEIRNVLDGY